MNGHFTLRFSGIKILIHADHTNLNIGGIAESESKSYFSRAKLSESAEARGNEPILLLLDGFPLEPLITSN